MDKFSYALGLGIGQQLKQMGLKGTLVINDFAASITDVLEGNDLKVSHQEGQKIVNAFFQELEQKQNAAKAAAGKVAKEEGFVSEINAKEIGKLACYLGAGRVKKEDDIDYTVGILLNKKVGQGIDENEILGYIYANDKEKLEKAVEDMRKTIKVTEEKVKHNK